MKEMGARRAQVPQDERKAALMTADAQRPPSDALRAVQRVTERELQQAVSDCARRLGWLAYHTHDSRHSAAGFPDLVLARRGRLIFAELKGDGGRLSPDQRRWLEELREVLEVEVYVWRTDSWFDGAIEEVLA